MMQPSTYRVPPCRMRGVTLIELLIVLVLVAVMLSAAAPSLRGMMSRNQMLGQADELASAMALARSEAARRGVQAGVCASQDGTTCSGDAGDWNHHLLVFVDLDNGFDHDDGEPVLKAFPAASDVHQSASTADIYFAASGFSNQAAGATVDVCHVDTYTHSQCRQVAVQPSGAVTVRTVTAAL